MGYRESRMRYKKKNPDYFKKYRANIKELEKCKFCDCRTCRLRINSDKSYDELACNKHEKDLLNEIHEISKGSEVYYVTRSQNRLRRYRN